MTTTDTDNALAEGINLELLLESLNDGEVEVTFVKVNGESTTRRFTRNLSKIPVEKQPKSEKSTSADVTPVFDLDKGDWRSFRNDSVTRWIKL